MKTLRSLSCLVILFTSIGTGYAVELASTRSCRELAINPSLPGGVRPLDQFLNNLALPENERNCWVHQDRTGKNWVITPYYWGNDPDDFNKPYIEDALLSLKESRRTYKQIGRANNIFAVIMSEERPDLAEAFWPENRHCYIEASYSFIQGESSEYWRQTVAHEVGHCFIMENLSHYAPENYDDNDKWWDESTAEWLSTLVWPNSNRESGLAMQFDLDGAPYRQAYRGFVFLTYFTQKFGKRATWQLVDQISRQDDLESLSRTLNSLGLSAFFQEFFVTHYQSQVVDIGGGFYQSELEIFDHPQSPFGLDSTQHSVNLPNLEEGRLIKGQFIIPAGHKVTFSPLNPTLGVNLHFQLEAGGPINPHLFVTEVSSSCDEDKKINFFLSHLQAQKISNYELSYSMEKVTECSCKLEGTVIDQCLIGTWSLDLESIREMLTRETSDRPVVFTRFQGIETNTFKRDGSGTRLFDWDIEGYSTHPTTRGVNVRYKWNGDGSFRFGTLADGKFCGKQTHNRSSGLITYTFPDGQVQTVPMNSNQGAMAPFSEDVTYTCDPTTLEIVLHADGKDWPIRYKRQ